MLRPRRALLRCLKRAFSNQSAPEEIKKPHAFEQLKEFDIYNYSDVKYGYEREAENTDFAEEQLYGLKYSESDSYQVRRDKTIDNYMFVGIIFGFSFISYITFAPFEEFNVVFRERNNEEMHDPDFSPEFAKKMQNGTNERIYV